MKVQKKDWSKFLDEIKYFWSKSDFAPCVWRLEAVHFDCPYPIGIVYMLRYSTTNPKTKKTFVVTDILDSFVQPWYRRRGVRAAMNKEIAKCSSFITSGFGSKSGNAFMKKQQYKEVPFGMYKKI